MAASLPAALVLDEDPPNQLLPLLSTETNLQTPTSLWKRQRAGEKKKGEKSTHMPTNWKKNNPGLVSLSCWLAAPSHCGGCSCLLDRDLARRSALPIRTLPHPSYRREGPGAQGYESCKEGLTEPLNICGQLQTQFPSLSPKPCRGPTLLPHQAKKSRSCLLPGSSFLSRCPLPDRRPARSLCCLPLPFHCEALFSV